MPTITKNPYEPSPVDEKYGGKPIETFVLPCGCTPGYGRDGQRCSHPCHWSANFLLGPPAQPTLI